MSKKTVDTEREDPQRQVLPVLQGEAHAVWLWLQDLFELTPKDTEPGKVKTRLDSMPERIVLNPVFGKEGRDMGPDLKSKEWRPNSSPPAQPEQLVEFANELIRVAQRHCSNMEKRNKYTLSAYSNRKGPKAYSFHMFTLQPGAREFNKDGEAMLASDDEDKHSDRRHRDELAHIRWMQEQLTAGISGVLALQNDLLRQGGEERKQFLEHIRLQEVERRQWMVAVEQAESKKMEREILLGWAQLKQGVVKDGVDMVRGFLPPLMAYATKGQVGIAEGLKQLLDGLSVEQRVALLGGWDVGEDGKPELKQRGVLDEAQTLLLVAIVEKREPPGKAKDLVLTLRPDQLKYIQEGKLPSGAALLSPKQQRDFIALAKVASELGDGAS